MMRAFENRSDTIVMDEPFYAAFLRDSGLDHPMRAEILAHHETDWRKVVESCVAPLPNGISMCYQKHMCHHMLDSYDTTWMSGLRHCFLLRDPARVLASYEKKREQPTLEDIGLPQQVHLFNLISAQTTVTPLVIDSADFLQHPRAFLERLCAYTDISFSEDMLSWPSGKRDSDGVWAEHWYNQVWKSTGFKQPEHSEFVLASHLHEVYEQARPLYETLYKQRVQIG